MQGHIRYLISVCFHQPSAALRYANQRASKYGKTQFQSMKVTLINSGILNE
jgi:hypothetical protein